MKTIKIPYYKETLDLHVAEENLKAVITAKMHEFKAEKSEAELVEEALANPIESKTLSELAVGKNKVVIVTSDHTRAVPSKLTLPILLYGSFCSDFKQVSLFCFSSRSVNAINFTDNSDCLISNFF